MAETFAKVKGKWHRQSTGYETDCGLGLPFNHEWTNKAEPTEDLCPKCFPESKPKAEPPKSTGKVK